MNPYFLIVIAREVNNYYRLIFCHYPTEAIFVFRLGVLEIVSEAEST